VSQKGTGPKAAIAGFQVAGKTGTAQKLVNGQYVHNQYYSSFIGFFPADKPELCIYVTLDNPQGKDKYAGLVAGPIFHDIGLRVASYLNMKPSLEAPMSAEVRSSLIPVVNRGRVR
jgi:cell division protein FtsI/penicillin-binding protein 2